MIGAVHALQQLREGNRRFVAGERGRDMAAERARCAQRQQDQAPIAIVLRSRTQRLAFLNTFRTALLIAALVAILAAILLSYVVARSVTRPLATITAVMREMAATGDLDRKIRLRRLHPTRPHLQARRVLLPMEM